MRTGRYIKFGRERDLFADLDDIADLGIVHEAFHVEDEYRRECVDEHLLVRIELRAGTCRDRDLHGLRLSEVTDRIT